ncbi:MAG: primosomal protein N' [bacterium]
MPETHFLSISVLAPLETPLTYSLPAERRGNWRPGQRVLVPRGNRTAVGVLLGEEQAVPAIACRPVEAWLEEDPTFTPSQLEFLKWAADYYLSPLGEIFRTALPGALTRTKKTKEKKGKKEKDAPQAESEERSVSLTPAQQKIADAIFTGGESGFSVHLLHGVTGSGKTEVYLASIEKILKQGKQAICLVPEIGLTPQTLQRYVKHFGTRVSSYHSGLSEGERARVWHACQKGEISILIGTRSALFAPFRRLGLLVVDEEQDGSYKQEERVRYHARDLAIVRGKIEKIPVILGSATPSVETFAKAQAGKFRYHALHERYGAAELPKLEVVDLRWEKDGAVAPFDENQKKRNFFLSPRLLEEIEANLKRGEQTLIFLNRRGFSHFLLCSDCGHTPVCPNCDITLTFHRKSKKLVCHYCDHQTAAPETCPSCQGLSWLPVGSGTERIEEELASHFPEARIGRMDRDTTSRKGTHQAILEKLARREIDLLVGTQMIAKGHDYPLVTLVGILSADTALHLPDFRSAESTFQLITQVSGRAGRANSPGRVLLQTLSPEHYAIEAAARHQVREFYEQELGAREELGYPPFSRLIVLRIQGTQGSKVQKTAEELRHRLEKMNEREKLNAQILGPSPCLLEKVRNVYRWQILLKCPMGKSLQPSLRRAILETRSEWLPAGLRLIIDVDPVHVI